MSFTVIRPRNSQFSLMTKTRSTLWSCITSRAASMLLPSITVTKRSLGVMIEATVWSKRFSKRKSRLVTMPTTLPSSTTGKPDTLCLRVKSIKSRTNILGAMVTGSLTIPLSWRFTLATALAWRSTVMFLCMIPIPPSWAMAMANLASVTVSMAADTRGMFREMLRVSGVLRETSRGKTVE